MAKIDTTLDIANSNSGLYARWYSQYLAYSIYTKLDMLTGILILAL
jgi:hypothetical protein